VDEASDILRRAIEAKPYTKTRTTINWRCCCMSLSTPLRMSEWRRGWRWGWIA